MKTNSSAGHLSLDMAARGDAVAFSFDRKPTRLSLSVVASIAIDVALLGLLAFVSRQHPSKKESLSVSAPVKGLIWLSQSGPGGGGGGGGNRMKEPPRRAQAPGHDALTVPAARQPKLDQPDAKVEPNPLEQLTIPVQTSASAVDSLPGVLEAPAAPPTSSQGPGAGGGAGDGAGLGNGSGNGPGLGPGSDGGTGDGVYQPGNGVTMPVALREVKPRYTSDAMRARLQGSVLLECVVRSDGSVGEVRIVRSLDSAFGLDLEAIKAAREWRFRPSVRRGEPVASIIRIQLDFVLR
jgi:TonB family protein